MLTGFPPWRSLRWVMAWTAQVAFAAILVRWAVGPLAPGSGTFPWVALTLVLAVGLFYPAGRAVAAVMHPRDIPEPGRCPRCARPELRPVGMRGRGLFEPVHRYRCGACWTPFELAGELLVEVGPTAAGEPPRIEYLDDLGLDPTGIEFLGEVEHAPRTSPAGACPDGMRPGPEIPRIARR